MIAHERASLIDYLVMKLQAQPKSSVAKRT
jgi:hypothetical protein